jgi:integrase
MRFSVSNLQPRGRNSYQVIIDRGRDPKTGKRDRSAVTLKGSRKEAKEARNRLISELERGTYVKPTKETVSEFFVRWFESKEANVGAKTMQEYRKKADVYILPELGQYRLSEVRPDILERFYSKLRREGRHDGKGGLSGQTVLHVHRLLHHAFRKAVIWGAIALNPTERVEAPRPEHREKRLPSADELGRVLVSAQRAGSPLHGPALVALFAGLRLGEILGLRWEDVDLEGGAIWVRQTVEETKSDGIRFKSPKSRTSRRVVAVSRVVCHFLKDHQKRQKERQEFLGAGYLDQGLVFPSPDGSTWSPNRVSKDWGVFVRKEGCAGLRFHDLRHAHATHLVSGGESIKAVSARLGHSTAKLTLDTYSHVLAAEDRALADRLEERLVPSIAKAGG